jgi:hypothetical protein
MGHFEGKNCRFIRDYQILHTMDQFLKIPAFFSDCAFLKFSTQVKILNHLKIECLNPLENDGQVEQT